MQPIVLLRNTVVDRDAYDSVHRLFSILYISFINFLSICFSECKAIIIDCNQNEWY